MTLRLTQILVSCLLCGTVLADSITADATVRNTVADIIAAVDQRRSTFDENPQLLYHEIDVLLSAVIDYDFIVRAVFSKHIDRATDEQIERFTGVFRHSMMQLYAKALVKLKAKSIEVLPATTPKPNRANVIMEVTTLDADRFRVQFSMGRHESAWRVRNISMSGINLGMIYRSQFDLMMSKHDGNIDAVINGWSVATSQDADSVSIDQG